MRPYWRKQGPDDCLHNGTVAMVTDSTCTGYVHVIALFRCRAREGAQRKAAALTA